MNDMTRVVICFNCDIKKLSSKSLSNLHLSLSLGLFRGPYFSYRVIFKIGWGYNFPVNFPIYLSNYQSV